MNSEEKNLGLGEIDFSIPEQAETVLEWLGGEEHLKGRYPAVYHAFLKTRDKYSKVPQEQKGVFQDSVLPGLICYAPTITENDNGETFLTAKVRYQGERNEIIYVRAGGNLRSLTSNHVYDYFDGQIDSKVFEHEFSAKLNNVEEIKNHVLQTAFRVLDVQRGGYLRVTNYSAATVLYNERGPIVTGIDVSAPYSQHKNNPLRVYYGRKPEGAELGDYIEEKNAPDGDNCVKIILPVMGNITLQSGVSFNKICDLQKYPNLYPCLLFNNEGIAQYSIVYKDYVNCFHYDKAKNIISFKFDKDWHSVAALKRFKITSGAEIQYSFVIPIQVTESGHAPYPVCVNIISSTLENGEEFYKLSKTANMAKIPHITLFYGCFSRDTKIQMADGSNQRIDKIQQGDMIRSAEGLLVQVHDIITGYEEELICIQTEGGRELRVTSNHPILTQQNNKLACDIFPGEKLTLADGTIDTVKYVFLQSYRDQVYSLSTSEKGEMLIANGFAAGDFMVQNTFIEPLPEEKPLNAEESELVQQMDLLMKELGMNS